MKRLIAIMLAVLMLVATCMLASCGEETPSGTTDPTTTKGDKPTEPTTTGGDKPTEPTTGGNDSTTTPTGGNDPTTAPTGGGTPSTPGDNSGYEKLEGYLDVNFGGRTFNIVSTYDWADGVGRWDTDREIWVETRDGGVINQAVYDRNAVMKNLYNCTIQVVRASENKGTSSYISDDVNSGTNTVDFGSYQYGLYQSNKNGQHVNAFALDLDFDIPGWNIAYFNETTIKDSNGNPKNYRLDGTFNLSSFRATWVLFCNLDLWEANFSDNIFDLVESREWTADKMIEKISAVAQDNGDSEWKVGDDTFGIMTTTYNAPAIISSFGLRFVQVQDYTWTVSKETILANNAVAALDKAAELYTTQGFYVGGYTDAQEQLQAGKTLFIGECMDVLERMADDENLNVTVIPEPLFSSETQDTYRTYVNNKASYYVISKNACGGDLDMISDFWNLYVFHSHKIVYPAFLQAFGEIYCQNSRAVDMINIILANRQYDYAGSSGSSYGEIGTNMQAGKNQISKAANSYASKLQAAIDTLIADMTVSE